MNPIRSNSNLLRHSQRAVLKISAAGAFAAALVLWQSGCQTQNTATAEPITAPDREAETADGQTQQPIARRVIRRSTLREDAISTLIEQSASNNAMVRANALESLAQAGPRLRAPLAAGLVDPNAGVRAIAAVLVGRNEMEELVPAARSLLHDESPLVRASAIYALRANRARVDPTPLGVFLLESPQPNVRAHAAFLFGELGDASAMPLLRQALHEGIRGATEQQERVMRLQIAEAMVKLGDRNRLEGIRAALYPSRPEELELAVLAVQILGRLGDRASMAQLINLSEYKQGRRGVPAEVRLAVADAAARMGRKEGWFIGEAYISDPDPLRRSQAALVLGQTGRESDLPRLGELLDDPNPLVRTAAGGAILTILSPGG